MKSRNSMIFDQLLRITKLKQARNHVSKNIFPRKKIFLFFSSKNEFPVQKTCQESNRHVPNTLWRPGHFKWISFRFQGSRVADSTFPGIASFYFVADCNCLALPTYGCATSVSFSASSRNSCALLEQRLRSDYTY